nr:hypothetical protein CFP56_52718 [Quercus suber]
MPKVEKAAPLSHSLTKNHSFSKEEIKQLALRFQLQRLWVARMRTRTLELLLYNSLASTVFRFFLEATRLLEVWIVIVVGLGIDGFCSPLYPLLPFLTPRATSCLRSPELFSTARLLTKITPISNSIFASHSLSLSLKTPNQNPNPNSTRLSATATSTLVFCSILHCGERLAS